MASNTLEKQRDLSGTGYMNTRQAFRNSNLKNPLLSLDTEQSLCETYGVQHHSLDGGSTKPKCHLQAQKPRTILYFIIPHTPPCRHQYVCMKICLLMAPLTQLPPIPLFHLNVLLLCILCVFLLHSVVSDIKHICHQSMFNT